VVKFNDWKIQVAQKLVRLSAEAENEKERNDLNVLIVKLEGLRYRELASYLILLHEYCRKHNKWHVCRELLQEPIEPGD